VSVLSVRRKPEGPAPKSSEEFNDSVSGRNKPIPLCYQTRPWPPYQDFSDPLGVTDLKGTRSHQIPPEGLVAECSCARYSTWALGTHACPEFHSETSRPTRPLYSRIGVCPGDEFLIFLSLLLDPDPRVRGGSEAN